VTVVHGSQDLIDDGCSVLFGEGCPSRDLLIELSSFNVLSYDVEEGLVLEDLKYSYDVRMIN
jgi:hypothetical protein